MFAANFRCIFMLFFIAFAFKGYAQTCTGSLGDPVISEDFGAGNSPGPPLSSAITNYSYFSADCPKDGSYTIAHTTSGCFENTWLNLTADHTGNPNGYMMIVNASFDPGIFFTETTKAGSLCPNTTYEFAAYITNLIIPQACGGTSIQPNITFSIETTGGQILKTYNTGDIPPSNNVNWVKYGTFFTTPSDGSSIVVKMVNNALGGCGNDLALDDITFRPCGPVIQTGFGSATGTQSQQLCEGSSATYTIRGSSSGTNSQFQWQVNFNNSGWDDIPGETADKLDISFVKAVTGSYQYRLGILGSSNSSVKCRTYSEPLTLSVTPLPIVPPIPPKTFCAGYPLTLTATGGASYVWTGPGLAPTSQNPLVINNVTAANAGTYTVVATSAAGCPGPAIQVQVSVVPKITAGVSNDISICAGESTPLQASGGLYYKWTPSAGLDHDDIANPVASPLQTTVYQVAVSNDGCSDNSQAVTVTVRQLPFADGGGNKKIFEGQSVKLNGTVKGDEITSVYWTPTTDLDDPTSPTPIASPTGDITYTLYVLSQNCGLSESSVFVRVYKKITIPNAFSPNNDGINDTWDIKELFTYPESSTVVFNRYGQKVYQTNGYTKPWDGRLNGATLPEGTYYYIIDLKNNTPKIAGWVVIVK